MLKCLENVLRSTTLMLDLQQFQRMKKDGWERQRLYIIGYMEFQEPEHS